jgi:hypothetical protein
VFESSGADLLFIFHVLHNDPLSSTSSLHLSAVSHRQIRMPNFMWDHFSFPRSRWPLRLDSARHHLLYTSMCWLITSYNMHFLVSTMQLLAAPHFGVPAWLVKRLRIRHRIRIQWNVKSGLDALQNTLLRRLSKIKGTRSPLTGGPSVS